MPTDTTNCSPKPILTSLTNFFLDIFGTNTIPDGYVEGDEYGHRTKEQDFAELFKVFYILLVITALMIFVFLMMILLLVCYYKRRKSDPKKCTNLKLLSLLLLSLLLLLLIFLAFALFITFKNSWDLTKKIITKDESKDLLDQRNQKIMDQFNEILIVNYADMKKNCLIKFNESAGTTVSFPQTEKICDETSIHADQFDDFIVDSIDSEFENILLYNDVLRMFSRNMSCFLAATPNGKQFVDDIKTARYFDYVYSLDRWANLYHAAKAISLLMHYYGKAKIEPIKSEGLKMQIYYYIEKYLNERELDAKSLSHQTERMLTSLTRRRYNPTTVYKFGFIMCIVAFVVLVIFFLILMCSLCTKQPGAMIKPLLIIFIILTLLFILMAFVTMYHFFYGVVEKNGICDRTQRQTTEESFYNVMSTECTGNQKIYSLMSDNNLVRSMSAWPTITPSGVKAVCKTTCTKFDLNFIEEMLPLANQFPSVTICDHFQPNATLTRWLNHIDSVLKTYKTNGYAGGVMKDQNASRNYYWSRENMSSCNLVIAKKIELKRAIPEPIAKLEKCTSGYNQAREFLGQVPISVKEIKEKCLILRDSCLSNIEQLTTVKRIVRDYIINAENKLNNDFGSCASILELATSKQNTFCKCEMPILNGVWVGSLLLLTGLLLTLLLLPCLICLFVKCDESDDNIRRPRTRGRRNDARGREPRRSSTGRRRVSAESIVLPPVTLPRTAIDMIRAHPDVQVRYLVKEKKKLSKQP